MVGKWKGVRKTKLPGDYRVFLVCNRQSKCPVRDFHREIDVRRTINSVIFITVCETGVSSVRIRESRKKLVTVLGHVSTFTCLVGALSQTEKNKNAPVAFKNWYILKSVLI